MVESAQPVENAAPHGAHRDSLEVFFDGECPLCSREVDWLRARNAEGRVAFTDIAAPDFDDDSTGRSREALMGQLHARTPSGEWLTGMDVIRGMYRAVGLGHWVAPTAWPGLRPIFDALYRAFARIRPYLPRRASSEACTDRCAVPSPRRPDSLDR